MKRAPLTFVACVLLSAGCGGETGEVIVDLRTDYVPGVEFTAVRSEVVGAAVAPVTTSAFATDDFIAGELVAELLDVPLGPQQVRVALIGPTGAPLDESTVRVEVTGRVPATFYIPRRQVACASDTDCVFAATCGEGRCAETACLFGPIDGACATTEYCDPDDGCRPRPELTDGGLDGGTDAAADSSVDAAIDAPPDTAPDVAPDTGTPIDLTDGLVAHWECETNMGNTAVDSTGNGHDAICMDGRCPIVVSGQVGNGFRFQGDEFVVAPDHPDFSPARFTVAAWVRDTGTRGNIVSKVFGTEVLNSWQLFLGSSRDLSLRTSNTTDGEHILGGPTITADRWTHVVGIWDGTRKFLYVDGIFIDSAAPARGISFDGGDVYIGADFNDGGPVFFLTGDIDDVRFYDRVLTDPEIAALASR
jgi:hypothetical protein